MLLILLYDCVNFDRFQIELSGNISLKEHTTQSAALAYHIRPMTTADINAVIVIENSVQITPWTERIFTDCLAVGYACWVVVNDEQQSSNHEIMGFAIASIALEECHLFNISIAQQWQRRGVGRYLMEHIINTARQQAACKILLEVRQSNVAAINLYQTLGFRASAIRKDYYRTVNGREDAFLLEVYL